MGLIIRATIQNPLSFIHVPIIDPSILSHQERQG
jgi:hypothetical protein